MLIAGIDEFRDESVIALVNLLLLWLFDDRPGPRTLVGYVLVGLWIDIYHVIGVIIEIGFVLAQEINAYLDGAIVDRSFILRLRNTILHQRLGSMEETSQDDDTNLGTRPNLVKNV